MAVNQPLNNLPLEKIAPWLFLFLLLIFTYAYLFEAPYVGFDFNLLNGEVLKKFVSAAVQNDLMIGDEILQVNSTPWSEYRLSKLLPIFGNEVKPHQAVLIRVARHGQSIDVLWHVPGFNSKEFFHRILGIWWVGYLFWIFGTITTVFVRPKDVLWLLLVLFIYLFAVFLVVVVVAKWRVWGSAVLFNILIWLLVPISLHLHWLFPKPLGRLPSWVFPLLYLFGFSSAALQCLQVFPQFAYRIGMLLVFLGSLSLLALHYLFRPEHRREIGLLGLIFGIASLPVISLVISRFFGVTEWSDGNIALVLPAIPGAYCSFSTSAIWGDWNIASIA